jgi:multiple sugar transport system substrate-binding protein
MDRKGLFRVAVRKFDPFESAIRKQWESFELQEASGLKLDVVVFDLHPLANALFAQQGLMRGEWDVTLLSTDWVATACERQCLLDLSTMLQTDPPEQYPEGWSESLLRMQRIGGAIYGVPYHNGPECLLLRGDLFDDTKEQQAYKRQYGTPLREPKTWCEFRQIARFFHRPEKGIYGTAFAAFPDGHNTVYDYLLQLWTRGGDLIDTNGNIRFCTAESVEALTFYRAIVNDPDVVHPACRRMDSVKSGLAFAAGEIAMMVNWFGFGAMAETIESSRVRGCVRVAPIPAGEHGSSVSLNSYWLLAIAQGSEQADIAYRFLKHCISAPMDKLLTMEGAIGCRRSTWNDVDVVGQLPLYARLEELHATARELPCRADWPEIAARIDRVVLEVIDTNESIEAIVRRADAQQAGN